MLALPEVDELVRDERPAFRPYAVEVAKLERLTPHFTRVTFTGPKVQFFGTDLLDQRIKIMFPLDGVGLSDIGADDEASIAAGEWYTRWRDLPDGIRNPIRTYTVRAVRQDVAEIDVDFVTHGDGGPAANWLSAARPGREVVIVGPDARSINSAAGIDWHPGTATEVLLAGDATAAPAICNILESLAPGIRARAFIQVDSLADALPVTTMADARVTWVATDEVRTNGGRTLEHYVREWVGANRPAIAPALSSDRQVLEDIDVDLELLWDSPETVDGNSFYAWLAGESAMIKSLRRFLVTETGIDRTRVAFMGYWRDGKSEAN